MGCVPALLHFVLKPDKGCVRDLLQEVLVVLYVLVVGTREPFMTKALTNRLRLLCDLPIQNLSLLLRQYS